MEKSNDTIDTLKFEDSTVLVIYHDTEVSELSDSVLIEEIEKRGDDLSKYLKNQDYGNAIFSLLVIVFVVWSVIRKRKK